MLTEPILVLKRLSKAFNIENYLSMLVSESKESSETFQEAWDFKLLPAVSKLI
jgi:hypothetical protein